MRASGIGSEFLGCEAVPYGRGKGLMSHRPFCGWRDCLLSPKPFRCRAPYELTPKQWCLVGESEKESAEEQLKMAAAAHAVFTEGDDDVSGATELGTLLVSLQHLRDLWSLHNLAAPAKNHRSIHY